MAVNNEVILSWTFLKKVEPDKAMKEILVEGEEILQCYQTVRDRSIDMWSTENAGKLFDINAELELWTKAGHFKIKVNSNCDIREFDQILGKAILSNQ